MNWIYVILPTCIARYNDHHLEIKHLTTDKWIDKSTTTAFWKMLEEDGFSTDEKKALEIHESYKKD